MTSAGDLDHKVGIYRRVKARDSAGQVKEEYVLVCSPWGKIKPLVGTDYMVAQQLVSEITHDVTIHYNKKVKSHMFVLYQGRYLEIMSAINAEEKSEWNYLKCKEVATL